MSENDIIAEYVKERFPKLLKTTDFAFYRLGCCLGNVAKSFVESVKQIDFGAITKAMKEYEEWKETEEVMQDTWKQQTMSRFERVD